MYWFLVLESSSRTHLTDRLVAVGSEGLEDGLELLGTVGQSLGLEAGKGLLPLVVGGGPHLPLLLELLHGGGVLPADLLGETANHGVGAAGLEAEHAEGSGAHHPLHLVVGRGHTLEDLQATKGLSTAGGLVSNHAPDGPPEDLGRGSVVVGTMGGPDVRALLQERKVLQLVAEERAGDVDLLATDHNEALAVEDLLGDDGSQTTEKVAATIDDEVVVVLVIRHDNWTQPPD